MIGERDCRRIAALDAASGLATSWDPGMDFAVYALSAGGGTVHAGGDFTGVGLQPRSRLAAITDDLPTAALVSLATVEVFSDRVELMWALEVGVAPPVTVHRSDAPGAWRALDRLTPSGTHRVAYVDLDVIPGQRYGYRLGIMARGEEVFAGETWVDVPAWTLALRGSRPNPSGGRLLVSLSLPDPASATLELIDLSGRRLTAREVGILGAGSHLVDLAPERPLPAGIYWLRLRQGSRMLTAKAAIVN